jgi:4-amino-4-deoxy-L-arabinose transferase-like glycosyltransferase
MLMLANPLLPALWTRALAESVLAFFTLLAFWLAIMVSERTTRPGSHFGWSSGLGLSLGLAAATKLSGVLGGIGLAVFVLAQYALRWWTLRRWPGFGPWPDAALTAVLVFMLVNPLLYPDPLGRTVMLFEHRRDEMAQQAIGTPRLAVPDELDVRAALMYRRTFLDFGTFQTWLGVPLDGLLTALGLAIALVLSWRTVRRRELLGPPTLLLCWMVATYVISTVNLGFDSSHYVALPVLWSVLLEALAFATVLSLAVRWTRGRTSAAPQTDPVSMQRSST